MKYEIIASSPFDDWLTALKDHGIKRRIANRLLRVEQGNFGDYKALGDELYELRLFFGGGLRIYYTLRGTQIVLLLTGGDKSSQTSDIDKARELLTQLD